jgi:hypothetical protein
MPEWLSKLGDSFDFSTQPAVELFHGGPIQVPKQVKFSGNVPVIPNDLADVPGQHLGVERVLHELNTLMNTRYGLDHPWINDIICSHISDGADFGTIFGLVRAWWSELEPNESFPSLQSLILYYKSRDEEQRANAIRGNVIASSRIPPRRIWDLYSNRVIPYWAVMDIVKGLPPGWKKHSRFRQIWPVSHSWAPKDDRQNILTPINGHEWPVPIPRGTSLDNVCIELLNLGAEYVWLDVLCLRQYGNIEKEHVRLDEWKLDVPTIGSIYHSTSQAVSTVFRNNPMTIIYYSGLGRAFVVGNMESPRHWLNRAWTLQETPGIRNYNTHLPKMDVAAGWTPYSPKRIKGNRRVWHQTNDTDLFFQFRDSITIRGESKLFHANPRILLASNQAARGYYRHPCQYETTSL